MDEPSDEALWEIENEMLMGKQSNDVQDDDTNIILNTESNDDTSISNSVPTNDVIPPLTNYASLAVSQLKDELNRRGLRVTGKKVDLIARLQASDNNML